MSSRRYVMLALLFTFLIVLAVPAWAQYQDSQGTGTSISACTIIDKPGSYALARNITARQSDLKHIRNESACILIVADLVSLDLRGYAITGPGTDKYAFGVYSTANASLKYPIATYIRNGSVTNFYSGVNVEGAGHTVEGVRVYANGEGISLSGDGHRVKDAVAMSNGTGISCWSWRGLSVEHSQIIGSSYSGISLWYDQGNNNLGSRIVGNTVVGNGEYGIHAPCPSLILQNMVYQNGLGDIKIEGDGCTQSDNHSAP
jgi:hypothetical protein